MASVCQESQAAIDSYLDEVWLERGLSENTLAAYRRDLRQLAGAIPGPLLRASAPGSCRLPRTAIPAGLSGPFVGPLAILYQRFFRHQVQKVV
jgi:integrase/recombinase XerD